MRRFEWALVLGLLASLLLTPSAGFARDCAATRQGVVRLHILAASDNDADQQTKLAVRDRLLAHSGELFALSPADGAEALDAVSTALPDLEKLANDELAARGSGDTAHAEITRMYFETRVYDQYILPAGVYDAVRVTIGGGEGKNWWCVMYPPLCLPAARPATDEATQAKTGEIVELEEAPAYRMGFATVELWERAVELVRQWSGQGVSTQSDQTH